MTRTAFFMIFAVFFVGHGCFQNQIKKKTRTIRIKVKTSSGPPGERAGLGGSGMKGPGCREDLQEERREELLWRGGGGGTEEGQEVGGRREHRQGRVPGTPTLQCRIGTT